MPPRHLQSCPCMQFLTNTAGQHLRSVLHLLLRGPIQLVRRHRLTIFHHSIKVFHSAVLAVGKASLEVLVLQVRRSRGILCWWVELILIDFHTVQYLWLLLVTEAPVQTTQGRRERKKWWRPRMHACPDSAGQCHTLAAKAVLWPCCSHPLPT